MPTYPLPTLTATVTAAGITAPPYVDIYESLRASFRQIYGADSYIDPDSKDGQLLAVFAKAIADSNDMAVAVWNKFSPATATESGLSSQVKINGIGRAVPSRSSVLQRAVGVIGTVITSGVVTDANGNRWLLPPSVTIPIAGQIDVTATAEADGALTAAVGTVTEIVTPQRGWQSTVNVADAAPGAAVETDAALRRRQAKSTAIPSQTVLDGITGAILALPGVVQAVVYENDTDFTDANGQPEHSIAAVVLGGDATAIAQAIARKKTPGAFTHGSTAVTVRNAYGLPANIRFTAPAAIPLAVRVTLKALPGFTTSMSARVTAALVAHVNALGIGKKSDHGRLYLPAQLGGGAGSEFFEVDAVLQAAKPGTPIAADVAIPYNARATLAASDVTITVTA